MTVGQFAFRRLAADDLPQLHRWLNDPGVVRWWEGDDVSWEAVQRHYGGTTGSTEHWIASADGTDIGWIQCYPAADDPEEADGWWALGIDPSVAGIDYLVGEPDQRGQGVGSGMIAAFVEQVVFGLHPEWNQVCAGPFAANKPSWRALERAGFRFVGTVGTGYDECRLMARDRL